MSIPTHCAACNGVCGEQSIRADLITYAGRRYPHFLCRDCSAKAAASRSGHATIADLVELRLLPPEGHA